MGARSATPPAVSAEPLGSAAKSEASDGGKVEASRWCEHDLGDRVTMGKRAEVEPTRSSLVAAR